MSSNDNNPEEESGRKRRRTIQDDDDDDESSVDDPQAAGGTLSQPEAGDDSRAARQALLARRAQERRRQRRRQEQLREELAELETEDFQPVDPADGPDSPPVSDNEEDDDDVDYEAPGDDDANAAPEEEEEDGEDLMENAARDYQRIEALDTYGTEGLDDREYDPMDVEARRRAEQELATRDRHNGGRNAGLYDMALDVADDEDEDARAARRGVFRVEEDEGDSGEETDEEDLDGDDPINIEAFDVPLREWIAQDRTRREIQRKFRAFLRHFTEDQIGQGERRRRGNGLYEQKIRSMCANNLSTLQVSYVHLMEAEPFLAVWLIEAPKDMLEVLNEAATRHTLMLFPSYTAIQMEIHVRISNVPITDSLRDLRRSQLDHLVKVHGVVTRRSAVYPQLQLAHYRCTGCKATQGPFRVESNGESAVAAYMPDECPICEGTSFRLDPSLSQYRNFQRVNLQETPGSVPPGRVPRTKEVLLTNDLIDIARPGEEIEVTGIYEHTYDSGLTLKSGFPVFQTYMLANHVLKKEDASSVNNLSEADVRAILELSKDPRIGDRIVQSIAPSIFGHDNCKMALAMSLFGGVPKNINDKHRIRGDVNVLLLGDPGTAKSQLLKYAEHTAPRAVYSTGKGASAVGLTAGVHKDPITKEWTLEGGALVLADKGVALIDEFDKSKCTQESVPYRFAKAFLVY
jgi:DNA replication licensing factor MCM2